MPKRKRRPAPAEAAYTVWHTGEVRTAPAREILRAIQRSSQASGELRAMSVQRYAKALVEDAPYFLPKELLDYFQRQQYSTEFGRALEYLAAMPTSGVRILARR
jgi:hypothetical protein